MLDISTYEADENCQDCVGEGGNRGKINTSGEIFSFKDFLCLREARHSLCEGNIGVTWEEFKRFTKHAACERALLCGNRWRNLPFPSLCFQTLMQVWKQVYLLQDEGTQCEADYYKCVSVSFLFFVTTSCAWLQTSTSRPLIGQQAVRAEWHMFPPLMTLLSRPWQARRRRGAAAWHVNVPESLLFATLWSSIL